MDKILYFILFKDDEFGGKLEILWLVFLLLLVRYICGEDDIEIFAERLAEGDLWASVDQMIHETTGLIEKNVSTRLLLQQDVMLSYHTQVNIPEEVFEKKAKVLIKAIRTIPKLEERYISKKGTGCIALMNLGSERYVALSGDDTQKAGRNNTFNVLALLLGGKYEIVRLNPEVRYYYDKHKYITYKDYQDWLVEKNIDVKKLDNCVNRMFSCCERKLLTKVYGHLGYSFEIYVKRRVCVLCEDALEEFDRYSNYRTLIKYIKKGKKQINSEKLNYFKWIANLVITKQKI